ncbi:hypothetical protein HHK36_011327 [Tetracentron sinense]|uniref:Uncharacterized protein n=1 Tax=Tetracentron sinense TaxID=13715 RepID=A0A834ZAZ4_TETSI|nr:hypothetical protein HHK36_011327 [Tetracentron sinense]
MAASVARRSAFLRTLWRTTNSGSISHSVSPPSIRSNFMFRQTRISPLSCPSRIRRESLFLNSLLPLHSAIASACLISKLPNEASTSTEGHRAIEPSVWVAKGGKLLMLIKELEKGLGSSSQLLSYGGLMPVPRPTLLPYMADPWVDLLTISVPSNTEWFAKVVRLQP